VEKTPILVPWVQGARVLLLFILILGFTEAYVTIKRKYGKAQAGQSAKA
jgi:hypothetical protein